MLEVKSTLLSFAVGVAPVFAPDPISDARVEYFLPCSTVGWLLRTLYGILQFYERCNYSSRAHTKLYFYARDGTPKGSSSIRIKRFHCPVQYGRCLGCRSSDVRVNCPSWESSLRGNICPHPKIQLQSTGLCLRALRSENICPTSSRSNTHTHSLSLFLC